MAQEITITSNTAGKQYVGVDDATGLSRYYDPATSTYQVSGTEPTTAQEKSYFTANPQVSPPTVSADTSPTVLAEASTPESNEQSLSTTEVSNIERPTVPDDTVPTSVTAPSNDDKATTTTTAEKVEETSNTPTYTPTENLLHNYDSYTYNLSLHLLSLEDYNNVTNNPEKPFKPTNVLISSAGRYGSNMPRNSEFNDDFYFDKFNMETVIGLNSQARNSNAIQCNFTIVEPYGMTLLNRIIVASRTINALNYLTMPYLIQLDFFGHKDGIPTKIQNITKYIPIKIVNIKTKPSTKGAEYEITAVPYNHQAFAETVATTPIKLEVTAATVGEFFLANSGVPAELISRDKTSDSKTVNDMTDETARLKKQQEANDKIIREDNEKLSQTVYQQDYRDELSKEVATATKENETIKSNLTALSSVHVKSYTGAVNAWLSQLEKDKKVNVADVIAFEIHEDIAKATFPDPSLITAQATKFPKIAAGSSQNGLTTNLYDGTNTTIIAINQGTSIMEVVGLALRNSSYITGQLADPVAGNVSPTELAKLKKESLNWFKIIPKVTLLGYDSSRNTFAKKITYQIMPYVVYNTSNNSAPMGEPKGYVKTYDYMFTGSNLDIINLDINFDATYFTALSVGALDIDALNAAAKTPIDKDNTVQDERIADDASKQLADPDIDRSTQPARVPVQKVTGSSTAELTSRESIAAQLQKQVLSSPTGDMISIKLKIVGDPDFIKQDDCFFTDTTSKKSEEQNHKTLNGSIITDTGEIFVNLNFKTATDYNANGLATPDPNSKYNTSIFSGLYKVIQVMNNFQGGKFDQELDLVRYPKQKTQGIPPKLAQTSLPTKTGRTVVDSSTDTRSETTDGTPTDNAEDLSSTVSNTSPTTAINNGLGDNIPETNSISDKSSTLNVDQLANARLGMAGLTTSKSFNTPDSPYSQYLTSNVPPIPTVEELSSFQTDYDPGTSDLRAIAYSDTPTVGIDDIQ